MATNIDKSLYQQPLGIDALGQDEPELEIEIVNPEEVTIGMPVEVRFEDHGAIFVPVFSPRAG